MHQCVTYIYHRLRCSDLTAVARSVMAGACGLLGQKRTAEIRQLVFRRALLLFVRGSGSLSTIHSATFTVLRTISYLDLTLTYVFLEQQQQQLWVNQKGF
jgi:hypothetical protein